MQSQSRIPRDPWLAASTMQKAIRRGEADLAADAAVTYFRLRGKMVWRRLIIIAFEDVGLADPNVVASTVPVACDAAGRTDGDDLSPLVAQMARRLAARPMDRSADYLISAIKYHPEWEAHRATVARLTIANRIRTAVDASAPLPLRATATWLASGVNGGGPKLVEAGDLEGLMEAFVDAGAPEKLALAVKAAVALTKEPITLFLPLLALASQGTSATVREALTPPSPSVAGVPVWALDMHTAIGKRAITHFARENDPVRTKLERHVPEYRARDVALTAAFYADAIIADRQLDWPHGKDLERAGMEADMLNVQCPRAAASEIIDAIRANLEHLNDIRIRALSAADRLSDPNAFVVQERRP